MFRETSRVLAVHSSNRNPFSFNPDPGPDSVTAYHMTWCQTLFLPHPLLGLKLNTFVMVSVKINQKENSQMNWSPFSEGQMKLLSHTMVAELS